MLKVQKVVYIPYSMLVLIDADKWVSSDLSILKCLARDQGVAKAIAYIAQKKGAAIAAKYAPYLGNAIMAYDIFNALVDFSVAARYREAITKHCGIYKSTGYTLIGGYQNFTTCMKKLKYRSKLNYCYFRD